MDIYLQDCRSLDRSRLWCRLLRRYSLTELAAEEAQTHKRELYMQTRIHARPVAGFTLGSHSESLIQELERTSVGLLLIFPLQGVREFQQCFKASAFEAFCVEIIQYG